MFTRRAFSSASISALRLLSKRLSSISIFFTIAWSTILVESSRVFSVAWYLASETARASLRAWFSVCRVVSSSRASDFLMSLRRDTAVASRCFTLRREACRSSWSLAISPCCSDSTNAVSLLRSALLPTATSCMRPISKRSISTSSRRSSRSDFRTSWMRVLSSWRHWLSTTRRWRPVEVSFSGASNSSVFSPCVGNWGARSDAVASS
mmetsp:Transcript_62956/g.150117  ORF Transcript_62956/g.150117 Transcript_62956/m.150117 type:complete len:208 (-) Transcript_62956:9-632(-)